MPKTSPMPRWGMARFAALPGVAPAAAGLPPANFLRRPSGTKSRALATILSWSDGGHGSGNILARREDFSRSAAVCAEHQPQQVGRTGSLRFQRAPTTFSRDYAAGARPSGRRSVDTVWGERISRLLF